MNYFEFDSLEDMVSNSIQMYNHFIKRTNEHIDRVCKYIDKIVDLNIPEVYNETLQEEKTIHDQIKFREPELIPYVLLTWRYKQKETNKDFDYDKETQDKITEQTNHHIVNSKHHPEYWSDQKTNLVNPNDRDKVPDQMIDATKMPLTFVAEMVADWLAMSEEKNTDPYKWVEMNVNKRWKFTEEQVNLILTIIDAVWVK